MHEKSVSDRDPNQKFPSFDCHCRRLRTIATRVTKLYDDSLSPAGLTGPQFAMMMHIKWLKPSSVTDLASAMGLD